MQTKPREFECVCFQGASNGRYGAGTVVAYEPIDGENRTAFTRCVWIVPGTMRD